MNLASIGCELWLLMVILFFFNKQEKVDFKSSRIFSHAIYGCFASLVLDIISMLCIIYCGSGVNVFVTELVCKLYHISLLYMSVLGLVYVVSQAPMTEKSAGRIEKLVFAIFAASVFTISALPISFEYEGTFVIYTYGQAVNACVIFGLFFLITTFLFGFGYRKNLSINFFATVSYWIGSEIVGTVLQIFFPKLSIMSFATVLGLTVVFIQLENPAFQKDKGTGAFNLSTFQAYIEDFFKKDMDFSFIYIKLVYDFSPHKCEAKNLLRKMAVCLRTFEKTTVFYVGQSSFMMVFHDPVAAEKTAARVQKMFLGAGYENGNSFIEVLETDGRRAVSLNEMMEVLAQVQSGSEHKENGIIRLSDETYERFRERSLIVKEIDDALEEDRVEAFFQPIYSLREGAFTGAEALVRIRKRDGSILPPGLFIPVSEQTGQVAAIGDRVFEKTLDFIKNGGICELGVDFIDVNLSVLQCEDKTLSDRYLDEMKKAGVSPHMFCFEITETAMIANRDMLLRNLNTFRSAGCGCSLDDFGNGESNLNYLVDMPINFIKADRSMVTRYTVSSRVSLIMDSMIHMAKGLCLNVVAEGVETDSDMNAMRNLQIDYIQGFYFSRPLQRSDFVSFLEKNRRTA